MNNIESSMHQQFQFISSQSTVSAYSDIPYVYSVDVDKIHVDFSVRCASIESELRP